MNFISASGNTTHPSSNASKKVENVESRSSILKSNFKKAMDTFCSNGMSSEELQSLAVNVLEDFQELASLNEELSYENGDQSTNIQTLLENNQDLITRLAQHINENRSNFPPGSVKFAAQYCWKIKHAPLTHNVPSFNYKLPKNCDDYLGSIIGKQPNEALLPPESGRTRIAWQLCLETTLIENFVSEPERDDLLRFFLKGNKKLGVDLNGDDAILSTYYRAMTDSQKVQAFNVFYDFLARHFEGNTVIFYFADAFVPMDTAMQALSPIFKNNPNVTSLDFRDIYKIELPIEQLCDLIENSIFTKKISLINCEITDEHVPALVSALNKNPTITEVNLRSNKLTLQGALELLECNTITSLDLESNELDEDAFKQIAKALKKNYSLVSLKLDENSVRGISPDETFISPTSVTQEKIDRQLERNRNFAAFNEELGTLYQSLGIELTREIARQTFELRMTAQIIKRELEL